MRLALAAAIVAAALVGAELAAACSCVRPGNPRVELARADGAIVARFLGRRPFRDGVSLYVYAFRVERVLKGRVARGVDVLAPTNSAACGLALNRRGQRVALILERRGRRWHSNLCWQREPTWFDRVRSLAASGCAP